MNQSWTISENGQTRSLDGDPATLHLRDVLGKTSGAQGGTATAPKVTVNGKSYSDADMGKSFADLAIPAGATIEVSQ